MTIDTSGNVSTTGNAAQARDKGGWARRWRPSTRMA